MAEVLSPLLQPTDMLQTRPTSSDNFQTSMSGQSHHQQRILQMQRGPYGQHGASSGYRGTAAGPGPVSPYAFKSTPDLRQQPRSASGPNTTSSLNRPSESTLTSRQRYPASVSVSTASSTSSTNSFGQQLFSKDDSVLTTNFQIPPFTTTSTRPRSMVLSPASLSTLEATQKPSPDRYRRPHHRTDSNLSASQHDQQLESAPSSPGGVSLIPMSHKPEIGFSNGDVQFTGRPAVNETLPSKVLSGPDHDANRTTLESAKRYRRRKPGSADSTSQGDSGLAPPIEFGPTPSFGDSIVVGSTSSRPSSANTDARPSSSAESSPKASSLSGKPDLSPTSRTFAATNVPRRLNHPSPLSQPAVESEQSKTADPLLNTAAGMQRPSTPQSAAAAAMAALSEKDAQKGVKSRLRRAFSFGSSAELRRAAGENTVVERARLKKQQFSDELDEEQDAIAQKQEAAGLGNSIYSGQGNVFTGSTDNLSISSTASSASIMLRKMGQGMKKGGRSIKGLFRPKSVIGVPAADGPISPSIGQVSMVTVEAERNRVNVNANPHDQVGGGTGFPRLERNSIDQARNGFRAGLDGHVPFGDGRRPIAGGEQERAEVLAAVKKGILKRSTTGSPAGSPVVRPVDLPTVDAHKSLYGNEPRGSPVPSVTTSEPRKGGHRRTDSSTLEGEDYFGNGPRIQVPTTRSLPGTPRGMSRNISFSPRIQFHDAWSSTEYDRRGDIATCNRLTPMLAQQIKEELNTFKMEMEVHEASKPHTHFF